MECGNRMEANGGEGFRFFTLEMLRQRQFVVGCC